MSINRLEKFWQHIVIIAYTLTAGIFWGAVAAAAFLYAFSVPVEYALLFVGMPVGVALAVYLLPKLPKALGFE